MSQKLLKSWSPAVSYEFDLRIGNKDYSNDLVGVKIRSAVNTPYQNISLDLFLDSTDLLVEEIYGQTPIKLNIILRGETSWPQITVKFDLLFLHINTDFKSQRTHRDGDQRERTAIRFETISRPSYQTMTTQVNGLYFGKRPYDIITDIISKNTTAEIDYDTNGRSKLAIDQFLIPPSTVYRTINYLNQTYGVFDGILGFHCSFDNKVKVQNLSKKTTSSQTITVHQLATNTDQTKIFEATDPTKFYTKTPIQITNRGNTVFSVLSPTNRFIVKPRNQLYKSLNINTEDQARSYGIISKNLSTAEGIFYDKDAIKTNKRISYHTNQTGYDSDYTFINANLTEQLQNLSQIEVQVQHDLPILNLMDVGEAVNFLTEITEYSPLSGYYVMKASEIGWIRSRVWESWAHLYLIRTNISVT